MCVWAFFFFAAHANDSPEQMQMTLRQHNQSKKAIVSGIDWGVEEDVLHKQARELKMSGERCALLFSHVCCCCLFLLSESRIVSRPSWHARRKSGELGRCTFSLHQKNVLTAVVSKGTSGASIVRIQGSIGSVEERYCGSHCGKEQTRDSSWVFEMKTSIY